MTTLMETKKANAVNGYETPCAIVATATAVPPNVVTRKDLKHYLGRVFDIPERRLEAMMSIVDNAQVDSRHMIFPVDYTIEPRSLEKTNQEYIQHAIELGQRATEECLKRAGMTPQDIDMIITVSCTGFMIPSLDAHLINRMGFVPTCGACRSRNWVAQRARWLLAARPIICNRAPMETC